MQETQLSLVVSVAEANTILGALGALPFSQVAPLIHKLRTQGESQVIAQAQANQALSAEPQPEPAPDVVAPAA